MRAFLPLELKDAGGAEQLGFECELKFAVPNADNSNAGELAGYGAVFNLMDRGGDIIHAGAFKKTLGETKASGAVLPMLWQHDRTNPIGIWDEVSEDEKGLKVSGSLIMDVPQAVIARSLIQKKAVRGLSIGYMTREADTDRKTGIRHIKRADLFEISLVTMPMNPAAGVTSVKGDFLNLSDREMEASYREGGLSQREAKIAVAVNKKMAQRDAVQPDPAHREGVTDAILAMRRLTEVVSA
jgi:uncharacterized protein